MNEDGDIQSETVPKIVITDVKNLMMVPSHGSSLWFLLMVPPHGSSSWFLCA